MSHEYIDFRILARTYIDLQQMRIAIESRLRKLRGEGLEETTPYRELAKEYARIKSQEKDFLKSITDLIKTSPIWEWAENIKGMGTVGALMLLGFIDPHKAETAGDVRAYFGLIPGAELRSGKQIRMNPTAKGRIWLITRNILMQKDPYYYALYLYKRDYYLNNPRQVWVNNKWVTAPPFKEILKNPSLCPYYTQCYKKLLGRAKREGRKPKNPPCKLHLHRMSMRWVAGLIVSHASQLLREALNLDTTPYLKHNDYIPPKGMGEPPEQIKKYIITVEEKKK